MAVLSPQSFKSGFTLIELLIVIAIISVLAAILFPAFMSAREKARQAVCLANQRQLGAALVIYANENDDKFMPGNKLPAPDAEGVSRAGWGGVIYPQVSATGVFRCPDDDTQSGIVLGETAFPISYFMNQNLSGDAYPTGMALSELVAPASTVVIAENTGMLTHLIARLRRQDEIESPFANHFIRSGKSPYERHTDGRTYLLADGHAKWFKPNSVSVGANLVAVSPEHLTSPLTVTFAIK